jgi:M6 family metalloprotease-like protein
MSAIFGETLTFPSGDGGTVELVVFGDEFHARYETISGFTAAMDLDIQRWCYALRTNGRLVSSGIPIDKPPPPGLRRHLKESAAVRIDVARRRYETLRPADAPTPPGMSATFGTNRGLLSGRRVSQGQVRGLTVLVEFSDLTSTVTTADVSALLNEPGYARNGNRGSVRDFYLEMSGGKLNYSNTVVGPVRLPKPQSFYIQNSLVPDALAAAVSQFGVNLSEFDSLGQGVVDAVNFLYAGRTLYQGELWPHNAERVLTFGSIRTHFYMLTSMGRQAIDLSIGTFCHESGHLLCRFPDVYDYGDRDGDLEESAGIGSYCLMGSGNHLGSGRSPGAICAYLRDLVGWYDDTIVINSPGEYGATAGEATTLLKFETARPNEYFLVENRTATGRDAALPASGLAVYHCDVLGSNEWEDGTRERHYQVALVQADGHLDLEHNRNLGDPSDLFGAGTGVALSDATTPSTRLWDGSASGMVVRAISAPGAQIRFRTGAETTTPTGGTVADLLIPDDDPAGARSSLDVAATGVLTGLTVTVDVLHPFIGDLQVDLIAPDGTSVRLRDREGGSSDNLHATYDSTRAGSPLAALHGKPAAGRWTLHVVDTARRDTGRLNQWKIDVQTGEGQQPAVDAESRPAVAIPDADPGGVADTITITEEGVLSRAQVEVEIRHPFIGDLTVELAAPSGSVVPLHQRTGGSRDDLVSTYDPTTTPSLGMLTGTPLSGAWTLRVRDTAARDVGRLERWALHLQR